MSKDILKNIIYDFDTEKFVRFFREKSRAFAPKKEELIHYDDENFKNGFKVGELKFAENEELLICAFKVTQPLTERSGKKAQYEKSKKILKETQSDAGIFIFYDHIGIFRFSLIYANYLGRKRDWSNFRRFTYFVSKEYTNKTFLQRIGEGNFSSLEKIKEAFSVEKVTREFYRDISYWYFWAVQKTKFPKDAEAEENGRNIAVIRLITRLIFIWFMRERGLVPNNLFDKDKIKDYLKDLTPSKTTYYKAILQNLFFATLNTKIKDRKFRFSKSFQGRNVNYMDPSIYRYEDYFKSHNDMLGIFKEIPFLNGGLFDCLDKRVFIDEKNVEVRIDGFSDKEVGLKYPNFLFFSEETNVDLNKDFGTKNKKYTVQGLINILSAYNFTIDENNLDDQEVALDPELLGKVFENLLASFNPETSSTARKATGSYYTPREIVDYMVTQSLKEYFKTHQKGVEGLDRKLDELFATGNENNPFAERDTKNIVKLIDALRIVDPAVGSGAFPMGILNKLVFVLTKLDPQNRIWEQIQIKAVEESVTDPLLKNKLKEHIAVQFEEKKFDYGRKLYLIQKCIYGVDIQQIAVEIAKLRFFISLLVDEKINKSKENWGIEPLPNLDYKIMQGNSLIEEYEGIKLFDEKLMTSTSFEQIQIQKLNEKVSELIRESVKLHDSGKLTRSRKRELELQIKGAKNSLKKLTKSQGTEKDQGQFNFRSDGKKKGEELKRLHKDFFEVTQKHKKDVLKQRIEVLEWEFIEATLKEQNKESAIREIEQFKKSNINPFFLWKLNFSDVFQERGGFDIVIGNPPYVFGGSKKISENEKRIYKKRFFSGTKKINLFALFIELGLQILKEYGSLTYIVPNTLLRVTSYSNIREFIYSNAKINEIVDLDVGVFERVTASTIIIFLEGRITNCSNHISVKRGIRNPVINHFMQSEFNNKGFIFDIFSRPQDRELVQKISFNSKKLDSLAKYIRFGVVISNNFNKVVDSIKHNRFWKPFLEGDEIAPYAIRWKKRFLQYRPKLLHRSRTMDVFETKKIIIQRITGGTRPLKAAYDTSFFYTKESIINLILKPDVDYAFEYILCLLNSSLMNWFYKIKYTNESKLTVNVSKEYLGELPIKLISPVEQKQFIDLVGKIINITKDKDYFKNHVNQTKVREYEKQINRLIYKHYNLTPEEIKIVEGEK